MGSVSEPDVMPGLTKSLKASLAEYRQVGKSGLRVSVPLLGTMSFGHPSWQSWILNDEKVKQFAYVSYNRS